MAKSTKHIVGGGKSSPKYKKKINKSLPPKPLPPKPLPPIAKPPKPNKPPKYQRPDDNGFIGAGLTGLGQQELQRRVKQHNALAQKAFQAAGGGKKETLTAADVANVYRGLNFQNRAKVMQTMADYEKIGKDYYKKRK